MSRTNPTDRAGIHHIGGVLTKLGLTFREQPIVDVGIDAFVELPDDQGDPSGKFFAVQIKSGIGNVHQSTKHYTYYCSHVHYAYWTSIELPMLFFLYNPDEEQIYFQFIDKNTLKKTSTQWKIEISKENVLNDKSISTIESYVARYSRSVFEPTEFNDINIEELVERVDSIREANDSLKWQMQAIEHWTEKTNKKTQVLRQLLKSGNDINSPSVKAHLKSFSNALNTLSIRMWNELEPFSFHVSEGVQSHQLLFFLCIEYYPLINEDLDLKGQLSTIKKFKDALTKAIDGVSVFQESINNFPEDLPYLKKPKQKAVSTLCAVIESLKDTQELYISFYNAVKDKI